MKKTILFLLVATISASVVAQRNQVKGSGNVTTENRAVAAFSKIDVSGVFKVMLQQGSEESVKVETDDNLQQLILATVEDGVLFIKMKKNTNFKKTKKMIVYINFKNVTEIKNSLVGNLITEGVIKADKLKYTSSAVGNSNLELEVKEMELKISSVGSTTIEGKANSCTLINSAVGSFDGSDFVVQTMTIKNSAVGSTYVNAEKVMLNNTAVGKYVNKNKNASKKTEVDI